MINRKSFYVQIRPDLFPKLSESQVGGIEVILNEWVASGLYDLRWLAYMLATTYHETARTMQPIAEYGKGRGRPYGLPDPITGKIYYGRGLVQLTWSSNYIKMGGILQIDLYNNPDLALITSVAVKIMFEGMTTAKSYAGDFTGKHLGNYFNKSTEDWSGARRIINGKDRAEIIAGYARIFYKSLIGSVV